MSSIGHVPGDRWEFDGAVVACFDDMLERSIPHLHWMRTAVTVLATRYAQEGTDIVDLGCSKGDAIVPLLEKFGAQNRFVLCDSSPEMVAACRDRFGGYVRTGVMRVLETDLATEFPACRPSVVLSVLTLQFVPIEHRQAVVDAAYKKLLPGGALIVVEKVLGASAELQRDFVEEYHALKASQGYSLEEIDRKRLSLRGVLVPVTAAWNEDLLRSVGFRSVDCFFRWLNFAGWVAVK